MDKETSSEQGSVRGQPDSEKVVDIGAYKKLRDLRNALRLYNWVYSDSGISVGYREVITSVKNLGKTRVTFDEFCSIVGDIYRSKMLERALR